MTVKLLQYPTSQDWMMAKICALKTIGKRPTSPPDEAWKMGILRARHSPVRELKFVFELDDLPYYVSVHLCRHIHARPYVGSPRNDRQSKYDRTKAPQDAPVGMIWSMEAEELIQIANKRLCGKADPTTRAVVKMMCAEVVKHCPEFRHELVPMCLRNGGVCHEMHPCGKHAERRGA